jgi:hypothetical protein
MYSKDGRMMVLMTRGDRPKPNSIDKITDEQRHRLFSSMLAYSGTYKFDEKVIEHHIDPSWNEVWSGTTHVRDIKKDGDRLSGGAPVDGVHYVCSPMLGARADVVGNRCRRSSPAASSH